MKSVNIETIYREKFYGKGCYNGRRRTESGEGRHGALVSRRNVGSDESSGVRRHRGDLVFQRNYRRRDRRRYEKPVADRTARQTVKSTLQVSPQQSRFLFLQK